MILEGWGKPGRGRGPRVDRHRSPRSAPTSTAGRVGDAVVGGPSPRCGRCRRCREGKPSQCENRERSMTEDLAQDGAFADYILVDARSLLALPDGLSPRAAALAEPLAVALHGITRAEIVEGDSVMVFGAGPIGALVDRRAGRPGHRPGHRGRARRAAASSSPATSAPTRCSHPSDLEVFPLWEPDRIADGAVRRGARVLGQEGGHGGRLLPAAPGRAPGHGRRRHRAADLRRATACCSTSCTVCGSFVYDAGGFERALELLASDGFPVDALIAPDDVPLDRLVDAMVDLASGPHRGQGDGRARPAGRHGLDDRGRLMTPPLLPIGQPAVQPRRHERAADQLDEPGPGRPHPLLPRRARLRRADHDDGRPQAAHLQLRALGPVHLPHRRGRAR